MFLVLLPRPVRSLPLPLRPERIPTGQVTLTGWKQIRLTLLRWILSGKEKEKMRVRWKV